MEIYHTKNKEENIKKIPIGSLEKNIKIKRECCSKKKNQLMIIFVLEGVCFFIESNILSDFKLFLFLFSLNRKSKCI